MELENLVGKHTLTGVDCSTEPTGDLYYDSASVINFVLDGITYSAIEDPSDGYRSMLKELKVSDFKVTNVFAPVEVTCVMRSGGFCDILDVIDVVSGKVVLSVGTDNYDDYYPSFVYEWTPENLCLNLPKQEN